MRIATMIFLSLASTTGQAQWVQTSGPEGGYPMSFATMGTTMYAGSFAGGVFRSLDNGENWSWTGPGLPNGTQVRSLAVDGTVLYAGTSSRVHKSTNGGDTWALSGTGIPNTIVSAVFVFNGSLFAGSGFGLYRSLDAGNSWQLDTVGLGDNAFGVSSFAAISSTIFAGTSSGGVYRSTNNGDTWTQTNSGLTSPFINTLDVVNGVLLAGTQGAGVFRSTDNGSTWSGGQFDITLALAVIGNDAFEATLGGVMRSTDAGLTWNPANTGIPPTNNTRSLGVLGTTLFVGMGNNGDKGGVYLSTDLGGTWVEKNTGYINTQVLKFLKPDANTTFAGNADGGLFKTTNNGTTWALIRNFGTGVTSLYSGGSYMFLGMGASTGSIQRSSDSGNTWAFSGTGLPTSGTITGIVEIGGFTVVGSSSGGIYRSTNSGASWTVSNSGLTNTLVIALITFGSYTYAGTNGGFFISSNSGQSWSISNAGLTSTSIQCMASPATSVIYVGTSNGGVFISTNNGANWNQSNAGLTSLAVRTLVAQGNFVFAGATGGVFVSTNSGTNWTVANTGLNNTTVQSLNLDTRDYLIAGTLGNGAWRRPYTELTAVKEIAGILPMDFSLEQNYPNPFNPSTTMRFRIPALPAGGQGSAYGSVGGFVSLKVYDMLGSEVATLVNEALDPGIYEATWDAHNMASGVYYYTLSAGNYTETRRMLLMK